jgi:hypothetical protein
MIRQFLCALLIAVGIAGPSTGNADEEAVSAARAAVLSWLAIADQGRAHDTWEAAAPLFQAGVSAQDWERSFNAARGPFGDLQTRQEASSSYSTTLPGAPDGEYVVFTFESAFDNKAAAVETVTAMKTADGSWRVAGYFIR